MLFVTIEGEIIQTFHDTSGLKVLWTTEPSLQKILEDYFRLKKKSIYKATGRNRTHDVNLKGGILGVKWLISVRMRGQGRGSRKWIN